MQDRSRQISKIAVSIIVINGWLRPFFKEQFFFNQGGGGGKSYFKDCLRQSIMKQINTLKSKQTRIQTYRKSNVTHMQKIRKTTHSEQNTEELRDLRHTLLHRETNITQTNKRTENIKKHYTG